MNPGKVTQWLLHWPTRCVIGSAVQLDYVKVELRVRGGRPASDPDAELRELIRHQHQELKDRQGLWEGYRYVLRDTGGGGNVEGLFDMKN